MDEKGKLTPIRHPINNYRVYHRKQLFEFEKYQYKQIGNAVPVNLGYAMGRSLVRLLNKIEKINY